MTIKEAKDQIKKAVTIYLMKDEDGDYRIPIDRQRPIFLLGAPGVGKTAIMSQIASEMGIGLVSYSMTHHTRQSALGLPVIEKETFDGQTFEISRYTMSEIIAAIYDEMKESGVREGILFLDEINCVSETLAPSMLQFLQYKTFGSHRVPEGWVIVTAGNPPEYNRSVRDFDVVTLDRMKIINVEPDFQVWRIYAEQKGIHKAVLSYLEIRPDDFYSIETTVDGKNYVTARGWEDLSEAITLYEKMGYPVDESLVGQYLHNRRIVGEFAVYYELYRKYREDYGIYMILDGQADEHTLARARKASFDERVSLIGLLLEAVQPRVRHHMYNEKALKDLLPALRKLKEAIGGGVAGGSAAESPNGLPENAALSEDGGSAMTAQDVVDYLTSLDEEWADEARRHVASGGSTHDDRKVFRRKSAYLKDMITDVRLSATTSGAEAFAVVKADFDGAVAKMKEETAAISATLEQIFAFVDEAFGDDNEMLLLVSGLTFNTYCASFIAEHGCESYYHYNQKFMMHERNRKLYHEVNEALGKTDDTLNDGL